MDERKAYILRELEGIFREWSARAAFTGTVVCLLLSPLDFYAVPAHAARFLVYRLAIAALLVGSGVFLRGQRGRATARWTVFLCVLASAVVVEAMILEFGGHHSPYLIGLILLAVTVLGLIPAGLWFGTLLAGTIFAVYLAPIVVWNTLGDWTFVAFEALLFAAILVTAVFIDWLQVRRLTDEIGLRHDLMKSRDRLEDEAARREKIAAELRSSQGLLASLATAAVDAIVMIDPEGTVRYWNPAAERIFGHTAAEASGRDAFILLAGPEGAGELAAETRLWLDAGENKAAGRRVVIRGRRSDGGVFPAELTMSAVPREGRLWTCAALRDITEQSRQEERLRLFAAAIEGATEGFYIVGLDGRILYVNPAGQAISGKDPASYMGRHVGERFQNPALVTKRILPEVMRAGSWAGEISGRAADGEVVSLWLAVSLVRDAAGRPIAMVGITKDFSGQKRLEEERAKSQKLESIGVLAGGLAHDFNNLLTIILGNLDLARLFAGAIPNAAEALDHASEAALRAGDLTRQLLTFSKGGQPVKRVGDIVKTIRESVAFAAAGSSISCAYDVADDTPPVEFDEGQMRQVIHNLVQNAREAMPAGGTLLVRVGAGQVAEHEVPGLQPGRYVRLQFHDRGSGIDRAHLALIFDPYFSTKEMDSVKGRGLGLAVSFAIVRNHGGTITADSSASEGTTISVFLPASRRPDDALAGDAGSGAVADTASALAAKPASPPPDAVQAALARARVLVMDDEPLVLDMAGAVLRRLGCTPTLAHSSAEAVVHYQIALDSGRRFDAVILDLTVAGGAGGPETLARLREIDPEVRAALSSGYLDHSAVIDWAGAGFAAFIAKPYTVTSFAEVLARLL